MSAWRGGAETSARRRAGRRRGERGALMMFVLMAILLVGAITVSAIQVISTDVLGSVQEVEADQVYNIAQAGVHYAIGQLQLAGAATYTGGTQTIMSGSTTLGTATITVNCIDYPTVNDVLSSTNPCTNGSYPGYRRIISTGTLPVNGPSRTIVAVVHGTSSGGGGGKGLCSLGSINGYGDGTATDTINVYSDIAANGTVTLSAAPTPINILGDPGSPQQYTGKVSSNSSITCASGCSVAGGLFPNQSGTLCSAPTVPAPGYVPGSTNVTVASGTTYTIPSTGGSFGAIALSDGPCTGVIPFTTLQINTSTIDPTATTVVQLNTLSMGHCGQLMITGVGKVDLRIGAPTGESLQLGGGGTGGGTYPQGRGIHFGVTPADTFTVTAPVPASRLTVWVNSNGTGGTWDCDLVGETSCAGFISHTSGGATIYAPNGMVQIDDHNLGSNDGLHGAIVTSQLALSAFAWFNSDTSGLSGGGSSTYSNFNTLMSWKDQ